MSLSPKDKDAILDNKIKIIPLKIIPSSPQSLIPQNNNTTENCCTKIDNSMTILTNCYFYTIIILSILLIISGILNIVLCSIENLDKILIIIAIDFGLILYSIFIIFSVLRIKLIRITVGIFCVICFLLVILNFMLKLKL